MSLHLQASASNDAARDNRRKRGVAGEEDKLLRVDR